MILPMKIYVLCDVKFLCCSQTAGIEKCFYGINHCIFQRERSLYNGNVGHLLKFVSICGNSFEYLSPKCNVPMVLTQRLDLNDGLCYSCQAFSRVDKQSARF